MATIITDEVLSKTDEELKTFIFDYLEDCQNVIEDINILVVLKYLGYIWEWDEETQTISLIEEGVWTENTITNIEDTTDETMDIETEVTHSYKANGLISHNTINLPETATLKDVADVYIDAHKRGIIGVTVYRDKCRGGILVHEEDLATKIKKHDAPRRPKILKGEMHQFVVNKQSYYVATGMMENDLYEVFTGINHNDDGELYIPKTVALGTIIKNGRGDYDFIEKITGNTYHLTNGHSNAEADALTRSISTSLRHGVDISIIVQQLEKTKGALNSFAKAITRMLKKYIEDGTKVKDEVCASCGSELVRIEGCKKCSNPECGTSICG